MNNMKEAIKKALEGGYDTGILGAYGWERKVLDPLFWQCLGKSLGWEEEKPKRRFNTEMGEISEKIIFRGYMAQWHHFIDWIAEGKSPDDFFNTLVTQK